MAEDTENATVTEPEASAVKKKTQEPATATKKKAVPPKVEDKPHVMQIEVRRTGLEESDGSGRYVRVLTTSYVNGAVHEKGAIVPWPKGVERLGPNLEEYTG